MDLLIVLTYVAIAWAVFKIFRIPVNQWTLATAALGGIFLVSALILLMNYNHPYTFTAQKAVISIPITPQVTGIVSTVTDKTNQRVNKGDVLFTIDPVRYQARVDRLQADLVTALAGPLPLQVICDMMGIPAADHGRDGQAPGILGDDVADRTSDGAGCSQKRDAAQGQEQFLLPPGRGRRSRPSPAGRAARRRGGSGRRGGCRFGRAG